MTKGQTGDADQEVTRYRGPSFGDMISPATWATMPNPVTAVGGRGRPAKPTYRIRKIWARQWRWAPMAKGTLFINLLHRSHIHTDAEFNNATRSLADCPVGDLFKASGHAQQVHEIAYRPGGAVEFTEGGRRKVNVWEPSYIKPLVGAGEADWRLWLEFLEKLIVNEDDRYQLMRWVATLVALPGIRILYSVLLYSEKQGVGKTTLFKIIAKLVGDHNSSFPSAGMVVNSQFNSWAAKKRLACINEIYEEGNFKAYDKIKETITEDIIRINEKMVPEYEIENWLHVCAASNSRRALAIKGDDRRWLIPEVTEKGQDFSYWQQLNSWLENGGHEAIAAWAAWFVAQQGNAVRKGEHAPDSARKQQMILDSMSRHQVAVMNLAENALDHAVGGKTGAVLVPTTVEKWLFDRFQGGVPAAALIRSWCRAAGMFETGLQLKAFGQKQKVMVPSESMVGAQSWLELRAYAVLPGTIMGEAATNEGPNPDEEKPCDEQYDEPM